MLGFSKLLPTTPGLYKFQAEYNGITTSTQFEIKTKTQSYYNIEKTDFKLYPNPSNGKIIIEKTSNEYKRILIYNSLGALLLEKDLLDYKTNISINGSKGLYLFRIIDDNQVISNGKFILE